MVMRCHRLGTPAACALSGRCQEASRVTLLMGDATLPGALPPSTTHVYWANLCFPPDARPAIRACVARLDAPGIRHSRTLLIFSFCWQLAVTMMEAFGRLEHLSCIVLACRIARTAPPERALCNRPRVASRHYHHHHHHHHQTAPHASTSISRQVAIRPLPEPYASLGRPGCRMLLAARPMLQVLHSPQRTPQHPMHLLRFTALDLVSSRRDVCR